MLALLVKYRSAFLKAGISERLELKQKYQKLIKNSTQYDELTIDKAMDAMLLNPEREGSRVENVCSALVDIFSLVEPEKEDAVIFENAYKLAVTFGSLDDTLKYLESCKFQITKACKFKLPEMVLDKSKLENVKTLKKWQQNSKDNMQFGWYRRLWADASNIESSISESALQSFRQRKAQLGSKAKFGIISSEQEKKIKQVKKELAKLKHDYKTVKEKKIKQGKSSLSEAEVRIYQNFENEQRKLQLKLAESCFGKKFNDYDLDMLVAHHIKLNSGNREEEYGHSYFAKYGIPDKKYEKFLNLDRVDNNQQIPPIVIDGNEVGHPGYYLRRLNVEEFDDALIAATLGKHTQCCQSISGEFGEPCAVHGITSPNGGFYIVCKGDPKEPKAEDPIILQSWTWRSKTGALVFDSIESKERARFGYTTQAVGLASAFYNKLTALLLTNTEYKIPSVSGGIRCGIWGSLIKEHPTTVEQPVDYGGNIDSYKQRRIASKEMLYLIEPDGEFLFFNSCAQDANQVENAKLPKYIQLIAYALVHNKDTLLDGYKKLFPNVAPKIISDVKAYLYLLDKGRIDKAADFIKNKNWLLNLQNRNGMSLLMLAAEQANSKLVVKLASKAVCDKNLVDRKGRSALMIAASANNWDVVDKLLSQGADPNVIDSSGYNLIFIAIRQNNIVLLRKLLTKYSDLVDLNVRDVHNNTPLIIAAFTGNLEVFQMIANQSNVDFNSRNRDGETALLMAIKNKRWSISNFILQRQNIDIEAKGEFGRTALMYAAWLGNSDLFNELVDRKANLKEKDNFGKTAFDLDSYNAIKLREKDLKEKVKMQLNPLSENLVNQLFDSVKKKIENYHSTSQEKMEIIQLIKDKMPKKESTEDKRTFLKMIYVDLKHKYGHSLVRYRAQPKTGLGRVLNIFYLIHELVMGSKGSQMRDAIINEFRQSIIKSHQEDNSMRASGKKV